ncbi:MAG: ribonuclease III [Minisyncoccia bacterium]|jgi:ribonuclease-3
MNPEEYGKKISITFKNKDFIVEALTHRSYLNEYPKWRLPHNERLEFLGDAVLELIVTEALFEKFPKQPEGQLTVLRAALVNYQILARVAEGIDLDDFVLMSRGERKDTGRAREVILANAMEAVIGAIYLDQGLEKTRAFVEKFVLVHLDEVLKTKSYRDAKSELQEIVQEKLKVTPTYAVRGESGPAHERRFTMGVYFGDKLIAEGEGLSKQDAEIEAAKNALRKYAE